MASEAVAKHRGWQKSACKDQDEAPRPSPCSCCNGGQCMRHQLPGWRGVCGWLVDWLRLRRPVRAWGGRTPSPILQGVTRLSGERSLSATSFIQQSSEVSRGTGSLTPKRQQKVMHAATNASPWTGGLGTHPLGRGVQDRVMERPAPTAGRDGPKPARPEPCGLGVSPVWPLVHRIAGVQRVASGPMVGKADGRVTGMPWCRLRSGGFCGLCGGLCTPCSADCGSNVGSV